MQELVDLFDDEDRWVRTGITMEEAYSQTDWFLRWANLLLVDSEWKYLVPRRRMEKKNFPGSIDFSAGWHVSSWETYEEAIVRESKEELWIDIDPKKLRHVHTMKYVPSPGEFDVLFHAKTYVYEYDQPITLNPDDISGAEWLTVREIIETISDVSEPKMKPWFVRAINHLNA